MSTPRHRMDGALFDRIALGGGGPEAVELLRRGQYSRRLLLVREVVVHAERHGGPTARTARDAWSLLAAVHRAAPGAVHETLTHPSLGPSQLRTLNALLAPDAATASGPHRLLAAAAVAALRAGLSTEVTLPLRHGRVLLPSLGAAQFGDASPGQSARVRTGPGGASVTVAGRSVRVHVTVPGTPTPEPPTDPEPGGTGWLALHPLAAPAGGPPLLLDDLDPDCFPASPGTGRLAPGERAHWQRTFTAAWQLLHRVHPQPLAEVAAVFRAVVPVLAPDSRDLSGSSNETFGCTGMSAPRSVLGLAVDLVHEAQHNKLAALTHLFDLVDERPGELFYAPWRDDPRPLVGLLHGVYAHLGVARFWLRQLEVAAEAEARHRAWIEFARWRDVTREANATLLGSGRLTAVGARFVRRTEEALTALEAHRVPGPAAARAAELARAHRGRWARRHAGPLRATRP
ncbi:HEXXH motif domain-containing protein [Streptomyces sp. NPDC058171]